MSTNQPASWQIELGKAVRAQRKSIGLTQLEAADLAGCGPVFVYEVEAGKKSTLQLGKLLDLLSVLDLHLKLMPDRADFEIDKELQLLVRWGVRF